MKLQKQNLVNQPKEREPGNEILAYWVYITFIASISFKTLGAETSVSFICKPDLAQKVLSRATATMTKVLENS